MWLLFLLMFQGEDPGFLQPLTGHVILKTGQTHKLVDLKIKGLRPYHFSMQAKDKLTILYMYRISRIESMEQFGWYRIQFEDGETREGRLEGFYLTGRKEEDLTQILSFNLRHIQRIHLVSGNQLRSCSLGHYEAKTPYPRCPICGQELQFGPFEEDEEDPDPVDPTFRFSLDARDPSPASRGN